MEGFTKEKARNCTDRQWWCNTSIRVATLFCQCCCSRLVGGGQCTQLELEIGRLQADRRKKLFSTVRKPRSGAIITMGASATEYVPIPGTMMCP